MEKTKKQQLVLTEEHFKRFNMDNFVQEFRKFIEQLNEEEFLFELNLLKEEFVKKYYPDLYDLKKKINPSIF